MRRRATLDRLKRRAERKSKDAVIHDEVLVVDGTGLFSLKEERYRVWYKWLLISILIVMADEQTLKSNMILTVTYICYDLNSSKKCYVVNI